LKTLRKNTGKRKRQFDRPDEFISITQRVLDYAKEHTKQVYAALAAVGFVLMLTVVISLLMHYSERNVLAMQDKALKYYDINSPVPGGQAMTPIERYKKASELFGDIINKHGGSPVAGAARYYKANADMETGDTAAAIEGYREVIEGAGKDLALKSVASSRLAAAYTAKGETDKAVSVYLGVIKSENDYLKDEAHFHLARIYENIGKKDAAVKDYEAITKEFPDSPWAKEAGMKVAELTGKPMPNQAVAAPGSQQVQVVPAGQASAAQPPAAPAAKK